MKILDVARSQLGVHEDPPFSNRVLYSAWYGMVGPWCDMFVSWCAAQAGKAEAVGKFAYTPSHEAWFRSKGREVPIRSAQPGDIVFFNFIGRTSHVGIVESNRGDGLITIEGNTNGGGSRDGGSVMRHFRSWSSGIVSVQRPDYANTGEDELAGEAETNIKNGMLVLHVKQVAQHEATRAMIKRKHAKIMAKLDGQEATLDSVDQELDRIRNVVRAQARAAAESIGGFSESDIDSIVDGEINGLNIDD